MDSHEKADLQKQFRAFLERAYAMPEDTLAQQHCGHTGVHEHHRWQTWDDKQRHCGGTQDVLPGLSLHPKPWQYCEVCGNLIQTMCMKNTGVCSGDCEKKRDRTGPVVVLEKGQPARWMKDGPTQQRSAT